MCGEVHYFRVARGGIGRAGSALLAEAGCTAVASYIPWLLHELPDGAFDLTGRHARSATWCRSSTCAATSGLWFDRAARARS